MRQITTLNGHFYPPIGTDRVFLDTDGNDCRENNVNLGNVVGVAANNAYNFVHLEPGIRNTGGPGVPGINIYRDEEALKKIADAYEDCFPSCP
ncbi:hypothetical protein JXQ70_17305 [bacterium]|nr:hypothetical protein [bacterium]